MDMMYIVTAIDIYSNEEMMWEFDSLVEANKRIRQLKDVAGRYVVKFTQSSTVVVQVGNNTEKENVMANLFSEPKALKKWAINLANACGGQEVQQTSIKLNKYDVHTIDKLIEQFVVDFNFNMQTMNEVRESLEEE